VKYVTGANDVIIIIVDAYFLGGGSDFEAKKSQQKCSRQRTTKGVRL